eukprot:748399-Hanusia_phi.AAC.1
MKQRKTAAAALKVCCMKDPDTSISLAALFDTLCRRGRRDPLALHPRPRPRPRPRLTLLMGTWQTTILQDRNQKYLERLALNFSHKGQAKLNERGTASLNSKTAKIDPHANFENLQALSKWFPNAYKAPQEEESPEVIAARKRQEFWTRTQWTFAMFIGLEPALADSSDTSSQPRERDVQNMYDGMIWFFVPVCLVIWNDVYAYVFGRFWGKTPLIKLSPKKTWEGFIAEMFNRAGMLMSTFDYMICSQEELTVQPFPELHCKYDPVFIASVPVKM